VEVHGVGEHFDATVLREERKKAEVEEEEEEEEEMSPPQRVSGDNVSDP